MNSTTPNRRRVLAFAAALGGFAGFAGFVAAQQQVNTGNALDANNRIGSNGSNGQTTVNRTVSGNQIVTGDVTAGRQFRGFVPYTAPGAFSGRVSGQGVDDFVRQSAGVPYGGVHNNNAQNIQPYYGDARFSGVSLPGYQEQSFSGGFVPAKPMARGPGDLRLGDVGAGSSNIAPTVFEPRPGQFMLPGPVDPSTQEPTVITASPLYGVRQWKFGEAVDQNFFNSYTDMGVSRRNAQLDTPSVQRLRAEVEQNLLPEAQPDGTDVTQQPIEPKPGGQLLNSQIQTPIETPQNAPIGQPLGTLNGPAVANPLTGDLATSASIRRKLALSPEVVRAQRTSTQYTELQQRLTKFHHETQLTEVEANREFEAQKRAVEKEREKQGAPQPGDTPPEAAGPKMPGDDRAAPPGGPAGGNPQGQTPAQPPSLEERAQETLKTTGGPPVPEVLPGVAAANPRAGTVQKPKPLQITSLSTGVKAKGLSDVLTEAESLMKTGKFATALDQYDLAEQIDAGNKMVLLGRATAELGASYYSRAEAHLRQALSGDPSLLMGQYDLKTWLGDDRLAFLVKDLKEIAQSDPKQARPVFLLAYIAYNTGNERRAAAYLDLAEKRAGNDPFYKLLREHWSLPDDVSGSDELNK